MNSFIHKFVSLFWRVYIFTNKLLISITLFQKLAIAQKVLSFKYFPIKKLQTTNEYFIFVISIDINNFRFLNYTLNSLKKIQSLRFALFLLDEEDIFDNYFIKEKIINQTSIEIFKLRKEMLLKLDNLMKIQKSNLFFTWINCGDTFSKRTFISLLKSVKNNKSSSIFYYDWIFKLRNSKSLSILFFPDYSPDLLQSINYLYNSFLRIENIEWGLFLDSISKFGKDYTYGLINSTHTNVMHIPENLCIRNNYSFDPPPIEAMRKINSKIREFNVVNNEFHLKLDYKKVMSSIIISSKDNHFILSKCTNSILTNTLNDNFEIIILDNSADNEQKEMNLNLQQNEKITIVSPNVDFNYSVYNNVGARIAKGDNFVFLNDDIEITHDDWLNEISQWLDQPQIGIVGGNLYYPDTSIQHSGIIMGLVGHAGNIFRKCNPDHGLSPFGSHNWYRNYYAVTGACLGIRKSLFNSVGGFNENYGLVYSDVALGVEVTKAGYRVLLNPFINLIHHEGKTRKEKIITQDCSYFEKEYMNILSLGDKFYNKNLSYLSFKPKIKYAFELSPLSRLKKLRGYDEK